MMCESCIVDFERICSEWLRLLRGKHSQASFSRRIGYRSNIAYRWETGRCFPLAVEVLSLCRRTSPRFEQALLPFLAVGAPAASPIDSTEGLASLLRELRGSTSIVELAHRSGESRFSISRWLSGHAEPRLPELLRLVDAETFRVLDFIACFVDPNKLPSVVDDWRALQAARTSAYDVPWSAAVRHALELEAYAALPRHRPGWLAQKLGISRQEEQKCIEVLHSSRQIEFDGKHWRVEKARIVDTRTSPAQGAKLKSQWLGVARERLQRGAAGTFGFNLMAVSEADFAKMKELHLSYFREMQALVADSTPSERVVLFNTQLFALDDAAPG